MRLLVVSNRLPIIVREENGQIRVEESVGGLVSGLSAYLDSLKGTSFASMDYVWVGWPGATIDPKNIEPVRARLGELRAHPVFLSEAEMDQFYFGFCNKTIWPLFHCFPAFTHFDAEYWNSYQSVNETFCRAVLEILQPGDIVWIHDYHLMLLPRLLRERGKDIPVGFFLHIPFPPFEIFRLLPNAWRKGILEGLLGADLIGFHTHDYRQYFLRCVLRVLGHEHHLGRIYYDERVIKADTFSMGIDFERYFTTAASAPVQTAKQELLNSLSTFRVILSVDRLDYTKGIINRLLAYRMFLEKYPEWRGKAVLILVIVPSRIGVEQYQSTKRETEEIVGEINGMFGSIAWTPILYQYKFLPLEPLVTLYAISDVALVTPLRDGMNLIAKEYIAARAGTTGVLVLSEMAGAAKELSEAVIINPNHIEEIAAALKIALEMPAAEQIRRNRMMAERLQRYDVVHWADDFVQTLLALKSEQKEFAFKYLESVTTAQLVSDFRQARRRLLLLDYDGTLVPFAEQPLLAVPSESLTDLFESLVRDPRNEIALISGRDRETMEKWFGKTGIHLVAEHGVWIREKESAWQMIKPVTNEWKAQVISLLFRYADRVPGSFVEEKEFSVAWHYRAADLELGSSQAKELTDDLIHFAVNKDVQVLQGSKVVEIRAAGVNKGKVAEHWISKGTHDFIFAAGDDLTDEDLFRALPSTAYSIKVGMTASYARFNLSDHQEVIRILRQLGEMT
ncbi:MAG: bifunctional alpha,alpha-trehalose-phosphate synthase (UDP-forming)/trehalose-phosphatase [Chloroflexi bacterium]|nr:bifunctional alpha,alpha-trehalose-phosphate synthase (UDP-forming)/trehalose-phosphatase [Chloroflexota bacterium]